MSKYVFILGLLFFALSWQSNTGDTRAQHRTFDATLWVQNAVEWRAHARQAFNCADDVLGRLVADKNWTAALEQAADPERSKKHPAIVIDIDETVLDNSPFQARLILDKETYSSKNWKAWVDQADASPVPGARAFLAHATRLGIEIFYVTNRTADLEAVTRKNLALYGFPLNKNIDTVLMKGEKPQWKSDKGSRRQLIAKTHRIVMLIGDDFADFSSAARVDSQARLASETSSGPLWGRGWFILPNPCYGTWQKALIGFKSDLAADAKESVEINALDPRRP